MEITIWFWIAFNLFILAMLTLDLGVFHKRAHAVSLREAGMCAPKVPPLNTARSGDHSEPSALPAGPAVRLRGDGLGI